MSGRWSGPARIAADQIPAITADQMREVDRAMVQEFHIELVQMMENAGRSLTDLAQQLFGPTSVTVLAGGGGNGGGGLAAARHLANRGISVTVTLARAEHELAPVTLRQYDILRRMGVPIASDPAEADLVIDGNPAGRAAELIERTNRQPAPVLSLDTPSGLEVTTGLAGSPCTKATATLTLGLPKAGLLVAPELVGRLCLADISVPRLLYERMGLRAGNLFAGGAVVEISA